jgi:Transglutaminase-like enzymes, putative cysteine proteases
MNREFFAQKYFALSIVFAMAMVAFEVAPWVAFFSFGLIIWKWGAEKRGWKTLSRRWTGFLSLLLFTQVLVQYRTLIGQEPSYTFLVGLSALRVMDYKSDRDHKFVTLLGFVLVSVKALFSIDIYWVIPSGMVLWGLWYSLLPSTLPGKTKILIKLFAISMPLTVILFLVFPRFVLPWAISRSNPQGLIGFSEELAPGKVAQLAASNELVLRAKVSPTIYHETRDFYWRGAILNRSMGLSWLPQRGRPMKEQGIRGASANYEVALEPTTQNYLFTLEGTREVFMEEGRTYNLTGGIFRTMRPLASAAVYRGHWERDLNDITPPSEESLAIPKLTGLVAKWVDETKEKNKTEAERIKALKDFFSDNNFAYTLSPGAYAEEGALEAFLFRRRRGFCEHFAGAYATLARALEIPSRVVVGYQGGRYNPVGDFWKVTQRDAHAWVEIFSDGKWKRVDPTYWVAPLRMFIGGEEFFSMSEADQDALAKTVSFKPAKETAFLWWDRATFMMDDLNYRWNYFLIDFDRTSQDTLWSDLSHSKLWAGLALLFASILCAVLFRSLFRTKLRRSEESLLLLMVEEWGAKREIPREVTEPPLTYFNRLSVSVPEAAKVLNEISEFYEARVYRETEVKGSIGYFKRLLQDFAGKDFGRGRG